jgi:hypothetical protein
LADEANQPPKYMKRRLEFERIGLPQGHAYPEMAFHSPTGSVIVQTRARKSPLPGFRLSWKRLNGTFYRPIADFPPSVSMQNFVLHPRLPLLYFITYVWSEHVNGEAGGDWEALYRFNLNTRNCRVVARRGQLVLPDGCRRAWLCELLSASNDGKTLFCKAGFHYARRIQYCLSKLSLADGKISVLAKMKTPFA